MSGKALTSLSKYNQNKGQAKALADTLSKNRNEILEVLGINPKHILSDEEYEEYEQIKNCIDNIETRHFVQYLNCTIALIQVLKMYLKKGLMMVLFS